jgi:hypothetical protein
MFTMFKEGYMVLQGILRKQGFVDLNLVMYVRRNQGLQTDEKF